MKAKRIVLVVLLFSILGIFNAYSSPIIGDYGIEGYTKPGDEPRVAFGQIGYGWTWISDELCLEYQHVTNGWQSRDTLAKWYSLGMIGGGWVESDGGKLKNKTRETFTGAWSQDEHGIWSFEFEDHTIPIDLTRIDGVLYCFNSYGELRDGNRFWNGQQTGADGVVTESSQDFLDYLSTQYVPECYTVTAAEPETGIPETDSADANNVSYEVYWTPNGEKYHSTRNCTTLSRSKTIESGSIESAGGRQPCKVCY